MDFGDMLINSIIFFFILFLIVVDARHIVSLENRVETLESYHLNVCSVCGQPLNN